MAGVTHTTIDACGCSRRLAAPQFQSTTNLCFRVSKSLLKESLCQTNLLKTSVPGVTVTGCFPYHAMKFTLCCVTLLILIRKDRKDKKR